jgi:SH3-like domain-containing protein
MTAEAYQGDWFKVQTADGDSGWVFHPLVEAYVGRSEPSMTKLQRDGD